MARKTDERLSELISRFGPPADGVKLYPVPDSHKKGYGGAELACEHVGKAGSIPGMELVSTDSPDAGELRNKLLMLCPACVEIVTGEGFNYLEAPR